ncbi:MAG TPA: 30S ribosomal protein S1 [Terriglobia bacterium]
MYPEDLAGSSPDVNAGPESPRATAGPVVESEAPVESSELSEMLTVMPEVSGIPVGQVTKGHIVKVTDSEVMVDIGLKSEGAIPRAEFLTEDGQLTVQRGDVVDVLIEEYDEQEGTFTVSHRKAVVLRAWEDLERASHENTNVKGRVLERTKGGLTVSVAGVRAFLPASQASIRPLRNPDSLIGQEIECRVIKLNQARNNVVVSRKAALEEEATRRKAELAERLAEGAEVTGQVKNLTSYGAFVDLGGMDGLLHVTDLAWGRVGHPSEVLAVGQEVRVKILKYDPQKERISLGLKQLLPDPWERVVAIYRPGDHLKGRVVSLTDYGAFCEIEPGIEGLIHVSEMTWSRHHKHPSKFVKVGDQVEVSVIEVNSPQRRISLSLRQTLGDPWTTLAERIAPGAVVEGRVRNLTEYGAFVEIEDGVEGLIHVSDLSWTKNVKHPSEVLKKGQKIRAAVVSIDTKLRRISLGLKQLEPDTWQAFFDETPAGSIVPGKVVRLAQFGAFVELREGIEGLCHASEMGGEHGRNGKNPLKAGTELPFRVIKVNREERKIGLSLREIEEAEDPPAKHKVSAASSKATAASPEAPASASATTMGEKMAQAIRAAAKASAARRPPQPVESTPAPAPAPAPASTHVEAPSQRSSESFEASVLPGVEGPESAEANGTHAPARGGFEPSPAEPSQAAAGDGSIEAGAGIGAAGAGEAGSSESAQAEAESPTADVGAPLRMAATSGTGEEGSKPPAAAQNPSAEPAAEAESLPAKAQS